MQGIIKYQGEIPTAHQLLQDRCPEEGDVLRLNQDDLNCYLYATQNSLVFSVNVQPNKWGYYPDSSKLERGMALILAQVRQFAPQLPLDALVLQPDCRPNYYRTDAFGSDVAGAQQADFSLADRTEQDAFKKAQEAINATK